MLTFMNEHVETQWNARKIKENINRTCPIKYQKL